MDSSYYLRYRNKLELLMILSRFNHGWRAGFIICLVFKLKTKSVIFTIPYLNKNLQYWLFLQDCWFIILKNLQCHFITDRIFVARRQEIQNKNYRQQKVYSNENTTSVKMKIIKDPLTTKNIFLRKWIVLVSTIKHFIKKEIKIYQSLLITSNVNGEPTVSKIIRNFQENLPSLYINDSHLKEKIQLLENVKSSRDPRQTTLFLIIDSSENSIYPESTKDDKIRQRIVNRSNPTTIFTYPRLGL